GETQESLSMSFRLGQSTVSGIIREVCAALITFLKDDYLRFPNSEDEWRVAKLILPLNSRFLYNYKGEFMIILLAIIDTNLRFIFIDVGTNRRISDSGVWNKCTLKSMLDNNEIKFPKASSLPNSNVSFPFVLVGDEGFPLSTKLLIPYPRIQSSGRKDRRIFNYRLSRARRTSENDFGVYNTRFQIFRSPIRYDPDIATLITQCCCVLHNFLRSKEIGRLLCTSESMLDTEDVYSRVVRPGEWREKSVGGTNFVHQGGNRHSNAVIHLRNEWCAYFNSTGAAP
ncbi:hypothetical protein ALC56_00105, partial [Trachymyrmex septentrionalis]